jgi:CheY-like chemotaxis protein
MARFLVVDEDAQIARVISRVAAIQGHSVETAADGERALALLELEDFDLLIIDSEMLPPDRRRALERLRADPRRRALKVLMVSGLTRPDSAEAALESGADAFVPKPFTVDLMLRGISGVLV